MANWAGKTMNLIICMAAFGLIVFGSSGVNGDPVFKLPSKESKFDGLYGIKIKRGVRCEKCCDLIFPRTFGLGNMRELQFLKEIINGWVGIEHDLQCMTPWMEDALDQLKYLATVRQDRGAAKMLLYPPAHGGFDLGGGELDEVYGDAYVRPVVEEYTKLSELLNEKVMAYVAQELCLAELNPVIDSTIDIAKLTAGLRKRKLTALAVTVESTCKKLESDIR